uniref:Vacuolar protein sorting-associated protein 51 homolog n=1 Tax=Arcella intermedia TaxID=1963864 RepID=A0A6B2L827_9EUKA
MKQLVHKNYKKFMVAADTINHISKDMEKLEARIQNIQQHNENITIINEQVNQHLQERRTKIDELSGVNNVLQQLLFLAEVPARLQEYIDSGNYGNGINYFKKTNSILENYYYIPSFKAIIRKSEALMDKIKEELVMKCTDTNCSLEQSRQYLLLLRAVDEDETQLSKRFYDSHFARMQDLFGQLKSTPHPTGSEQEIQEAYLQYVQRVNNEFLPLLITFCTNYKSLFVSPDNPGPTSDFGVYVTTNILETFKKAVSKYIQKAPPAVASKCILDLNDAFLSKECPFPDDKSYVETMKNLVVQLTNDTMFYRFGMAWRVLLIDTPIQINSPPKSTKWYEELFLISVEKLFLRD